MEEKKGLKILTARNGIALVAVLAILLILSLLLPVMFSYSEHATYESVKGTDKQRASYLARTSLEMSVAAFEDLYNDAYDDDALDTDPVSYKIEGVTGTATVKQLRDKMNTFFDDLDPTTRMSNNPFNSSYVIMYNDPSATPASNGSTIHYKSVSINGTGLSSKDIDALCKAQITDASQTYIGYSVCSVNYDASIDYYQIDSNGDATEIEQSVYDAKIADMKQKIKDNASYTGDGYQYTKIENRNVIFESYAYVNGKGYNRKCILVLPTEPDDQQWLLPTKAGSNQIFPDTSKATGLVPLDYTVALGSSVGDGTLGNGRTYIHQPLYTFSCLGNMLISFNYLRDPNDTSKYYIDTHPEVYDDLSLGLYPEVTTIPENDPTFNCLKAVNMNSWFSGAQKDNFVAFTSTSAIQVSCPISLYVSPCRTDRVGDGIAIGNIGDKNYSLYKVMIMQAPVIFFEKKVECMLSFYTPPASKNDEARRMSTIVLSAPSNTPYSYINTGRNEDGTIKTSAQLLADSKDGMDCKAGMVYFAEDCYIWVIPYLENGTGYSDAWYNMNSTVYYKNSDMKCYKLASAGDVYLYNSEISTGTGSSSKKVGFSLSSYFAEVIYPKYAGDYSTEISWWKVWSRAKKDIFNTYMTKYTEKNYCEQDFHYLGNVNDASGTLSYPKLDGYVVYWES